MIVTSIDLIFGFSLRVAVVQIFCTNVFQLFSTKINERRSFVVHGLAFTFSFTFITHERAFTSRSSDYERVHEPRSYERRSPMLWSPLPSVKILASITNQGNTLTISAQTNVRFGRTFL